MGVRKIFESVWSRVFLSGVHYSDRHDRLDTLYRMENPWRLDSAPEAARFVRTNEIIQREFGFVGRLLEIGSGEGHQSSHLLEVCGHLYGREISARAVARAQRRCPGAVFTVGDISCPFQEAGEPPFDLVVACEVIYYMSDAQAAVDRMCELGRACLVTYFQSQRDLVAEHVAFPAHAMRSEITYEDKSWTVVFWKNAD